ncbi:MAG: hypothetical protein PHH17_00975 [Candidatus Pacebacteria bacterium]|jgi:hypothetical protein|nr:hypothetical protein [Candidatus Paceibacterota bacterium]MDD3072301.1 hypothetical protein [Candidatus Paceibacterota bacterium]MDD4201460.1 hypothetical protein [Candidatus Paceibacterota bacterium]MDD4467082.1 hypothetical protein [Candidatus Paceibacterota bacterium]MDD4897309.1 hypothetical protein [Candidatus Paceibacterota bacterium]
MTYFYIKHIIGWILLLFGVSLIVFTLLVSYNIFTGKTLSPQIFVIEEAPIEEEKEIMEIEDPVQKMIFEEIFKTGQISNIFPAESMNMMMNLISFSIFAFIFLFGGGQIAGIGVRIITIKQQ